MLDSAVIMLTYLLRAAVSYLNDSASPVPPLGIDTPRPLITLRAASTASIGSDLPSMRRTIRVGRSTSIAS